MFSQALSVAKCARLLLTGIVLLNWVSISDAAPLPDAPFPDPLFEYDAGLDGDSNTGNGTWVPNINNSTSTRDFGLTNTTFNGTPTTGLSGLSGAYSYSPPNTGGSRSRATTGSFGSLAEFPNNAAGSAMTVEFWLRPSATSLSDIDNQLVFESGGGTHGAHLQFVAQGTGTQVRFRVRDNNTQNTTVTQNLTDDALLDEFIHIVGVVDPGSNQTRLHINGGDDLDGLTQVVAGFQEWQRGGNASGLGGTTSDSAASATGNSFLGDIAVFRLFDTALTDAQVADLFLVQQSVQIPEPASIAIWSLIGLGLAGFGYYRIRRKK